jgi:hypothetical protein
VRLDPRIQKAKDETEKETLGAEADRLEKELDAAERVYVGHISWVAYPVGLVAAIVGTVFPVQAVDAGLMFGGLCSLTAGFYPYWDRMQFGWLAIALASILVPRA